MVVCARCGNDGEPLQRPPIPGAIGQQVVERVCRMCWTAWVQEQANLINHLGLRPFVPYDRQQLYRHMREFLRLD